MRAEKDFEELLSLLNRHKVRYCIVGSYAVAFHSRPRYTKDLDILIDPNPQNARRILKALADFGFRSLKLTKRDFVKAGNVIQLGYEPLRVDIITKIEGLNFNEVWRNRVVGSYGKHKVMFMGKKELIRNKQSLFRDQDKVDLKRLLK